MSDAKKERPIPFSVPMVRAILAGQKTVTRRAAAFSQPSGKNGYWPLMVDGVPKLIVDGNRSNDVALRCPYGIPGDRLWVRESFYPHDGFVTYMADCLPGRTKGLRFKRSIHMPRKLSRINLEITEVGVERLHDISEENAIREGCKPLSVAGGYLVVASDGVTSEIGENYVHGIPKVGDDWLGDRVVSHVQHRPAREIWDARHAFSNLWRPISGDASWGANPWVWVVGFKRVEVSS